MYRLKIEYLGVNRDSDLIPFTCTDLKLIPEKYKNWYEKIA